MIHHYLFIYLLIYLFIYLSIYLYIYIYLSIYLFIYLFIYLCINVYHVFMHFVVISMDNVCLPCSHCLMCNELPET